MTSGRKIPREQIERAKEIWITHNTVHKCIRMLRDELGIGVDAAKLRLRLARKSLTKLAEGISPEEQRAKIEGMFAQAFEAAMQPSVITGQPNAAAMATVAQRMAEMYGVSAPIRFEHSGPNGGPITTQAVTAKLAALVAARARRDAGGGASGDPGGAEPAGADAALGGVLPDDGETGAAPA